MAAIAELTLGQGWPPTFPRLLRYPVLDRLSWLSAVQLGLAVYVFYIVKRCKPGFGGWTGRLVLSVPAFIILCAAPFLFDPLTEILYRTSVLFVSAWLATQKILAMCINRGSLAHDWTFIQFLTLLYLPIFPNLTSGSSKADAPRGRLQDAAGSPVQLFLQFLAKITLLAGVVFGLNAMKDPPDMLLYFFYSFGLVGFLGLLMDGPASIVTGLIGLKIIPTFDQPWFSSSLADFWGRRWNITTSSVLRVLYYDPLVEGRLVKLEQEPPKLGPSLPSAAVTPSPSSQALSAIVQERAPAPASPLGKQGSTGSRGSHAPIGPDSDDTQPQPQPSPQKRAHLPPGEPLSQQGPGSSGARGAGFRPRTSRWRRLTGTCATFLASGLAHEYIINMLLPPKADGSRPWLGKWTVFFAMQAPLLLCEIKLKRVYRSLGWPQPNIWLSRLATIAFLLYVARYWFFSPVDKDSRLADMVKDQVLEGFVWIAEQVWQRVGPVASHLYGSAGLMPASSSIGSGAGTAVSHDKSEL